MSARQNPEPVIEAEDEDRRKFEAREARRERVIVERFEAAEVPAKEIDFVRRSGIPKTFDGWSERYRRILCGLNSGVIDRVKLDWHQFRFLVAQPRLKTRPHDYKRSDFTDRLLTEMKGRYFFGEPERFFAARMWVEEDRDAVLLRATFEGSVLTYEGRGGSLLE